MELSCKKSAVQPTEESAADLPAPGEQWGTWIGTAHAHSQIPIPAVRYSLCAAMAVKVSAKADPRLSFSEQYKLSEDLGK